MSSLKVGQLSLRFEDGGKVAWVDMRPEGIPCMSPGLVADFARAQGMIETRARDGFQRNDPNRIVYQVMTSGVSGVFCLGGDLEYFLDRVDQGDRQAIEAYARQCIEIVYKSVTGYGLPLTTIALVQGQALGGGFEAALANQIIVAEESATFGFPEVLFGTFPGMGAVSLLTRRSSCSVTRRIVNDGRLRSARELYDLGIIDVLAQDGQGEKTVRALIQGRADREDGFHGLNEALRIASPISYKELMRIVNIWVEVIWGMSPRNKGFAKYLLKEQKRRWGSGE